jgi:hypothetical protein
MIVPGAREFLRTANRIILDVGASIAPEEGRFWREVANHIPARTILKPRPRAENLARDLRPLAPVFGHDRS